MTVTRKQSIGEPMSSDRFAEIRKDLNMSRAALGQKIGRSREMVRLYEDGSEIPSSVAAMMRRLEVAQSASAVPVRETLEYVWANPEADLDEVAGETGIDDDYLQVLVRTAKLTMRLMNDE